MAHLRIFIEATHRTPRGQFYTVRLGSADGPVIVERSLDPEHAACRYLAEQGLKGRLEVWSAGRNAGRMIIPSIEAAAGVTVRDDNRRGVVRGKHQPLQTVGAGDAPPSMLTAPTAANDDDYDDDKGGREADIAS